MTYLGEFQGYASIEAENLKNVVRIPTLVQAGYALVTPY